MYKRSYAEIKTFGFLMKKKSDVSMIHHRYIFIFFIYFNIYIYVFTFSNFHWIFLIFISFYWIYIFLMIKKMLYNKNNKYMHLFILFFEKKILHQVLSIRKMTKRMQEQLLVRRWESYIIFIDICYFSIFLIV